MSEEDTKNIIIQLLDALALFQDKSIIHRDIKPENVLVYGNPEYNNS